MVVDRYVYIKRRKQLTGKTFQFWVAVLLVAVTCMVVASFGCRQYSPDMKVRALASGAHSQDRGRDVRFAVAADPDSFRALIGRISVPDRSPVDADEIDFESELVIAAFMGVCPTAGYSISFDTTARNRGNTLEVRIRTSSPAAEGAVAQVITSPYTLAVVERTSFSRIRFLSADGRELRVLEVP